MCWHVIFKIEMLDDRDEPVKKIEKLIEEFKVKPEKRGIKKVTLVKGSISEGFETALHCDCDRVKLKMDEEGSGFQLLDYPALFKIIIAQDEVKNIQVHWYWTTDEPKEKEKKITINEFLSENQTYELSSKLSYRIIKEKYY